MLTLGNGNSRYAITDGTSPICGFEKLYEAAHVLRYLNNGEMSEDERETALAFMARYDKEIEKRHQEYEEKRRKQREKAAAAKAAKAAEKAEGGAK